MNVAIPIFDGITALDAIGPYEVLSRLPRTRVHFVAAEPGLKRTETGMLALHADATLSALAHPDVVVFPGGFGTRALMTDEQVLAWVRTAHESSQWTTSVCTGALVLAAAGVLDGLEATTHWLLLDKLGELGATPVTRRVVEQGKIITAAGVSSGIDMALTLAARIAGEDIARAIQLGIEYDPQPPFDGGSVAKASPEIIELARGRS
ncbi:MAG: DJ-1/PfpI family protein [Solirubrobacterales bacterium]|nr:DJ-1/PfpI family protein [Solirubrobacterales bacterium]MBV9364656.1 DJ-1/PfpI family protein [Solirubrobacterales bacterium]